MSYQTFSFRNAEELLSSRPMWLEFKDVLDSFTAARMAAIHENICSTRKRIPAGGQIAANQFFEEELVPLKWKRQPFLFDSRSNSLRRWKMDFIKERLGVEITFNHAEAIPWIFSRLNIAAESSNVQESSRIDVGIAVFAGQSLKTWSKMDNAVGTFELAVAWLNEMKPILPSPIMVIGLSADRWAPTSIFRGTSKGNRSKFGRE
jgi:hypothetical protein